MIESMRSPQGDVAFPGATSLMADEQDTSPWYACYTRGRAEKKVDLLLRQRGVETFLPLIRLRRKWHDRIKTVEWPLFPSYVFVRGLQTTLGSILMTPGVTDIVRMNGRPAQVTDAEIRNIAAFAGVLGETEHEPRRVTLEPGQSVKIASGPFQGLDAVVVEVRGRRRVLVGLRAIRVGFEVDVPADSLITC